MLDRTFLHMASTSGGQIPPNKKTLQAIRSAKDEPAADVVSCRGEPLPRPSQIETRSMPLQQGSNSWRRTTGSDCQSPADPLNRSRTIPPVRRSYVGIPSSRRAAEPHSNKLNCPSTFADCKRLVCFFFRLAHPPRQPEEQPREGRNLYRNQPDFHRKAVRSRRFLLTMRLISYIMLTKKSG